MLKDEKINYAINGIKKDLDIDESLAHTLVNKFIDSLPQLLKEIKDSRNNGAEFERLVHTLKGTSGNLRLNDLYEAAKALNDSIKNIDIESIEINLKKLETEINSLIN